jgi:cytosine/adenosine deaminase-related metal-dependent hydrolase
MNGTTLITGVTALTMDSEHRVIPDAALLIDRDTFVYVGPREHCPSGAAVTLDGAGMLAMPGLVNAHTHVPQILLRGAPSQGRRLQDWLNNVLAPGLAAYTTEDFEVATLLYCAEAVRSGMTTVVANEDAGGADYLGVADPVLRAFARSGLRVYYARMIRDLVDDRVLAASGAADLERMRLRTRAERYDTATALAEYAELSRRHHGVGDGRIEVWPAPATTVTTTLETYAHAQRLAREHGTGWTIHLAETPIEQELHGCSPVQLLDQHGLLDENLLAAHCVHLGEADLALLAERGVRISTQPTSNAYLGAGIAPVPAMLQHGVTVGLGTDDANANDSINLFSEMRVLALLHQATAQDPAILPPRRVLELATSSGAAAVGAQDRIGTLEVGKRADLVLVDLGGVRTTPVFDPATTLIFQAGGSEVDTVLVDGRVLMRHGTLTFLTPDEEQALCREAQERAERIIERAGLTW